MSSSPVSNQPNWETIAHSSYKALSGVDQKAADDIYNSFNLLKRFFCWLFDSYKISAIQKAAQEKIQLITETSKETACLANRTETVVRPAFLQPPSEMKASEETARLANRPENQAPSERTPLLPKNPKKPFSNESPRWTSGMTLPQIQAELQRTIDPIQVNCGSLEQHNAAKTWLQQVVKTVLPGCEVFFASARSDLNFEDKPLLEIDPQVSLNPEIFSWAITKGVQVDILNKSMDPNTLHVFGVASQFNSTEATSAFVPKPGQVMAASRNDNTQGPLAQRTNARLFELVNGAANLGMNILANVLKQAKAITALIHGYLTPGSQEELTAVRDDLKNNWRSAEIACVKSIPDHGKNPVILMMGAAPALGRIYGKYLAVSKEDVRAQQEMQFYAALANYTAQFNGVLRLADANPDQTVVYHPTAPGLGVFGNESEIVARAFQLAALEFQQQLTVKNIKNVKVEFPIFRDLTDFNYSIPGLLHLQGKAT